MKYLMVIIQLTAYLLVMQLQLATAQNCYQELLDNWDCFYKCVYEKNDFMKNGKLDVIIKDPIETVANTCEMAAHLNSYIFQQIFQFEFDIYIMGSKECVERYNYKKNELANISDTDYALKCALKCTFEWQGYMKGDGTPNRNKPILNWLDINIYDDSCETAYHMQQTYHNFVQQYYAYFDKEIPQYFIFQDLLQVDE